MCDVAHPFSPLSFPGTLSLVYLMSWL